MPVQNLEIAELFKRYATLLEIEDANVFRVRAYRNAARVIEELPTSLAEMLEAGADLAVLPAVGDDLAHKIAAIVETGRFAELDALEQELPRELGELVAIPGLGPKRVVTLYRALGIASLADLRDAAGAGRIRRLPGFSEASEAKILKEVERRTVTAKRFLLATAERLGEPLLDHLRQTEGVRQAVIAGSFRRRKETVGDLDFLVAAASSAVVMQRFVEYDDVDEVIAKGPTRSTVRLRSGLQVDLRVVPEASYGAALHYFTGSKAHNIATRTIAVKKGLKLNEYGVFRGARRIAGRTEAELLAMTSRRSGFRSSAPSRSGADAAVPPCRSTRFAATPRSSSPPCRPSCANSRRHPPPTRSLSATHSPLTIATSASGSRPPTGAPVAPATDGAMDRTVLMIEINAARRGCASVTVTPSAVSAKAASRSCHVRRSVMAVLRALALATVLTGTALVGGCASQGEMSSMNSRIGELEQSVSALNQRLDAMASKDQMAAERAAKSAEDARQAAQAAAESSAQAEAAFRKSLRK